MKRLNEIFSLFAFGRDNLKKFSSPIIAFAYYKNRRINLLGGHEEEFSLSRFKARLDEFKIDQLYSFPVVFHLMYELGFLFTGDSNLIGDEQLLAVELVYQNVERYSVDREASCRISTDSQPNYHDYEQTFKRGYEHLLNGDCYQFNLTYPFKYQAIDCSLDALVNHFWNEGPSAYGHGSVLEPLGKTFFSNSPECLFQMKKKDDGFLLWAMPIKGTIACGKGQRSAKWEELDSCQKNRSELDMITDLLRNDLSAIEKPIAQVIRRNYPLQVPSILHQYSLISVELGRDITLGKILKATFPGGSVTGAPKKRVMEILSELEETSRGFYCGSTLLFYKEIMAASINIRSLTIDKNQLTYNAGGGVTLRSSPADEYQEMLLKTAQLGK